MDVIGDIKITFELHDSSEQNIDVNPAHRRGCKYYPGYSPNSETVLDINMKLSLLYGTKI